jgi:glc operon protein GlcG
MRSATLAIALVLLGLPAPVRAQNIINEASITLDAAVKAGNACEALAKAKGWKVTIWVVDDNGVPVYVKHMDGAVIEGIYTAEMKTKTAKIWLSSSDPADPKSLVGQTIKTTDGQIMNILLGAFPNGGGVPIFDNGKFIGAIGVGGANNPPDGQCAQAGADAVMKK